MKASWKLIFLLGLVSLFADITYEGARSIIPVYFTFILGASVVALGVVVSFGDFLGYSLRLLTGPLADLWRRYWAMAFIGYAINLVAVPLLALAGDWGTAATLIILERIGKAIRTPARDVILSSVARDIGPGKAFGIHEVMDQVGAVAGPSLAMAILYFKSEYRLAFLAFAIPALLSILALGLAYAFYRSREEELVHEKRESEGGLKGRYWAYLFAVVVSTAGFVEIKFLLYRAKEQAILADWAVPSLMLLAMAVDAVCAILAGLAYDRFGIKVIYLVFPATALIPILALFPSIPTLYLAAALAGIVIGFQETVERAAVADLAPMGARGRAYGIFNGAYGLSLLLGGALVGYLYSLKFSYIIIYAIAMQVLASLLALRILK